MASAAPASKLLPLREHSLHSAAASVRAGRNGDAVSNGGAGVRPLTRREALWAAGAAAEARPDRLPGTVVGTNAPLLPEMDEIEVMSADLQTLGLSPGSDPMAFARSKLTGRGVVPNADLVRVSDGAKVIVAGVVTHRQRPATAGSTNVSQLGRRDRARERHLLARMLDPLSQGGALGGGAARTWAARTGRGG